MDCEHHHHHHHGTTQNRRVLTVSLIIIASYMLVEVIGGFLTGSLALLADAGHMLSDAVSLGLSLIAFTLSSKTVNKQKTYGYKRLEILAAVLNGILLLYVAGYIIIEAVERFSRPTEITTSGMLLIAIVGLFVNIVVAWYMMRGGDVKGNLNMRGAYLHVISDMIGSIGAIIAALMIMYGGWNWADPVASIIVALLVLRSGYIQTKASVHVLMEGSPTEVNIEQISELILSHKEIITIHDLHVWSITSGYNALTCHAVVDADMSIAEAENLLHIIEKELIGIGIHHTTIQIETPQHKHHEDLLCHLS